MIICYSKYYWHWGSHNNLCSIQRRDNIRGRTSVEWHRIMELHGPSCKYLSNDNLTVPDVQWPVFADFPRVKLILPKKSTFLQNIYVISCHEQRRLLMGTGERILHSGTKSKSSKAWASSRPASLCFSSMNVCCSWHLSRNNKGPSRLDLHPGYIHWDICFTVVIYWDNSRLEICDGEQMRLRCWEDVSDNRAHNTQAQDYSFALYCLLRVMLHPDGLL